MLLGSIFETQYSRSPTLPTAPTLTQTLSASTGMLKLLLNWAPGSAPPHCLLAPAIRITAVRSRHTSLAGCLSLSQHSPKSFPGPVCPPSLLGPWLLLHVFKSRSFKVPPPHALKGTLTLFLGHTASSVLPASAYGGRAHSLSRQLAPWPQGFLREATVPESRALL